MRGTTEQDTAQWTAEGAQRLRRQGRTLLLLAAASWGAIAVPGCDDAAKPSVPDAALVDTQPDDATTDAGTTDTGTALSDGPDVQDGAASDAATQDADVAGGTDAVDAAQNDAQLSCPGATGCPCQQATDCNTGVCLEQQEGRRCSALCVASCPDGLLCQSLDVDTALLQVCVDPLARRCLPCTTSEDCTQPGGGSGLCTAHTSGTPWTCTTSCSTDASCGPGWVCAEALSAEGQTTKQCLPAPGSAGCGCTGLAVELAATGRCGVSAPAPQGNLTLTCAGTTSCSTAGGPFASCVATPDGACVDNACAGKADKTPCNDGNDCTSGEQCAKGRCTPAQVVCACQSSADCASQEDGNPCNGTLICDPVAKTCVVDPQSVVECAGIEAPQCQLSACDPATGNCGFVPAVDGSSCDDGEGCTIGDVCKSGQCQPGPDLCTCKTSADCAGKPVGNPCFGSLYCDKASLPWSCKPNPASAVQCPTTSNSACAQNTCDAKDGQCKLQPLADGTSCNDGIGCTVGDACLGGSCKAGTVTCTCATDNDCQPYDDGNACNGKLFCNKAKGQCQVNPATVVVCPSGDDTACSQNLCQPATGLCAQVTATELSACDDGNPCTTGEVCTQGECGSATNTCACSNDADCAAKEDGNLCNGTLYCDLASGSCAVNPATVVQCDPADSVCEVVSCVPATGKCQASPSNEGLPCEDQTLCTVSEVCKAGSCGGGTQLCGCEVDADCKAQDDANLCNGSLYCDRSGFPYACKLNPASVISCPTGSDSACVHNTCDPQTGSCALSNDPTGTACDDGNPCTTNEACQQGSCKGGNSVCQCQTDADCPDDADQCNGEPYCDVGVFPHVCKPKPASAVSCDASGDTACERNTCQPATGSCALAPVSNGSPCDDNNLCTEGDGCVDGSCSGDAKPCPADLCDAATCDPQSGSCGTTPLNDGSACDDGMDCTTGDVCSGGFCNGQIKAECVDGDDCTLDSCDASGACKWTQVAFVPCDDGDICTKDGQCQIDGSCSGAPPACDDNNPCTVDSCAPDGACSYAGAPLGTPALDVEGGVPRCVACAYGACGGSPVLSMVEGASCVSSQSTSTSVLCTGLLANNWTLDGPVMNMAVAQAGPGQAALCVSYAEVPMGSPVGKLRCFGNGYGADGQQPGPLPASGTDPVDLPPAAVMASAGGTTCAITFSFAGENLPALWCWGDPLPDMTGPALAPIQLAEFEPGQLSPYGLSMSLTAAGAVPCVSTAQGGVPLDVRCYTGPQTWTTLLDANNGDPFVGLLQLDPQAPGLVPLQGLDLLTSQLLRWTAGTPAVQPPLPGPALDGGGFNLKVDGTGLSGVWPDGRVYVATAAGLTPLPFNLAEPHPAKPVLAIAFGPDPCLHGGMLAGLDGSVWLWGPNDKGQLGTAKSEQTCAAEPVQWPGLTLPTWLAPL